MQSTFHKHFYKVYNFDIIIKQYCLLNSVILFFIVEYLDFCMGNVAEMHISNEWCGSYYELLII